MNKFIILLTIFTFITFNALAQELKCRVNVQTPRVTNTDPAVFKTLEDAITKFMNERKWTEDTYTENEKIDCVLNIIITEDAGNDFYRANASIQLTRPVFNADYKTPLYTFQDKNWEFQYQQFQDLNFNEGNYTKELPVLLGYYANLIIANYYDTFSLMSGTPYFLKAQNIVGFAQNSSGSNAWKPFSSIYNRAIYVDNMLDSKLKEIREINYSYHRKGLDVMYDDVISGREEIMKAITTLEKVKSDNPGVSIMTLQTFFDTKSQELVDIMSGATGYQKQEAYNKLSQLNPVNSSIYQKILSGK